MDSFTSEDVPQKQCPRCKERKPLTSEFFYSNKTKAGGFDPVCKVCVLAKVPSSRKSAIDHEGRKQCGVCKEFFPQTREFFVKKKNGLDNLCKTCRHEYKRAAYVKEHPPQPKEAPDGFKKCTACLEILPATLEYFHAMARNLDGLRTPCKKCCSAQRAHPRPTKNHKPGYKICTKCFKELPATKDFFHSSTAYKDGLAGKCKQCVNQEYRDAHPIHETVIKDSKQCVKCLEELPATLEFFHAQATVKDGLRNICKKCRAKNRQQQRLMRIDEARAYERAIKRKNKAYYQRYHQINHERINARGRQHYYDRIEYYREQGKKYRKSLQGQEHRRVRDRNRRARLHAIGGTLTKDDIQQQYKRQRGRCYYCKNKIHLTINGKAGYHADHIIPVTREGSSNDPWNIVLTCQTCNLKKGNKLLCEWPEGSRLL